MEFVKNLIFWNREISYSDAMYLVSLGETSPYPNIVEPLRKQ